jgi:phenylacetate-CoA ligase
MNLHEQIFLAAHDAMGSELRRHYREFLTMERWPADRWTAMHEERLTQLLQHAITHSPYYRERVQKPELATFPILRKDEIRAHFEQFMEPSLRAEFQRGKARGYSWVEVKSGGTTGTPTTVLHDRDFRDWGRAGRLYSQYLCGFPLGTPHFKLWGSMREINQANDSFPRRAMNRLLRVQPLNAFLMSEERMAAYVRQIDAATNRHLMAYVDAADQLARFIEKKGLRVRPLETIMACAGTVTDDVRARLQRVFGARVHNKYGSRECAELACECERGGFHIYGAGVHLEAVDERGEPVPPGTTGRILVTLLHNRRFPMIRYEIGDVGALAAEPCPCGRPAPLLQRVEGRLSELLTSPSGGYVSPVYIRHLIGVVHNPGSIERFQFVQESPRIYTLALQIDPQFGAADFAALGTRIEADLRTVLGDEANLTLTRSDRIAESASGKFLYVVRRPF